MIPSQNGSRGFALLMAVVFMSVMLSFGLALGSLAYKQSVLASSAVESQYAFYVADGALECALYADQQEGLYAYPSDPETPAPSFLCDGIAPLSSTVISHTASRWVVGTRLSLDSGSRCADVTIYKPADPEDTTSIFAEGYNVPCATVDNPDGARFVSRGIEAHY